MHILTILFVGYWVWQLTAVTSEVRSEVRRNRAFSARQRRPTADPPHLRRLAAILGMLVSERL
jgi:hypothetical protein